MFSSIRNKYSKFKKDFYAEKARNCGVALVATPEVINPVATVISQIKFADVKVYDQAMDAVYNATHIGGGNHRLYDGGHTVLGAFNATKDLGDSLGDNIIGTSKALINDFVTPKGLPIATMSKEAHHNLSSITGLSKDTVYDLCSVGVNDLMPASIIAHSTYKLCKKQDMSDSIGNKVFVTTIVIAEQFSVISALGMVTITVGTITQAVQRNTLADHKYDIIAGITAGAVSALCSPIVGSALYILYQILRNRRLN